MSLSGAAAAMGIPEALVERSAAARAAESGSSIDEILAAWAGGETVQSPSSAETEPEPAPEDAAPEPEESAAPAPAEPVVETPQPVAAAAPTASAAAPTRAPVPAEVTLAEAVNLPEVVTVATAGIKERPNYVLPRWLIGLLLLAPIFALFALGGSATGACGEATELTVDVLSGEIVNCDGSEFTGAGPGGGATDFISLGGELYAGNVVPAATCAGCHGANGQGAGGFPPMTGVITTFGACEDHIEWVLLGSSGWESTYGNTYGDTNKPVAGGMPPHAALSDEQLRAVVAFERVRFGGADPAETLADCGLVEADGEGETDGEGEGEGEQPPEGEGGDAPTATTMPPEASRSGS